MATARALQYARTLTPDDLRAVHFDIDSKEARELEEEWGRLGLSRLPARHHRVPRPPVGSSRHRTGGRRHAGRRHRVHGAAAPPGLRPGVAALPARPHGRQDRRRPVPGAPRQRHHHPVQPARSIRREGAPLRSVGPSGPPDQHGRRGGRPARHSPGPPSTARGAPGWTGRSSRQGQPPPGQRGVQGRRRAGQAGRRHHADLADPAPAPGQGCRPGEISPGAAQGRAPPTSNAC